MTKHANRHDGDAPSDLALYTPSYLTVSPPDTTLRVTQQAWSDLLQSRPLFYLPNRTPHGDYDASVTRSHRHQLWRTSELESFGDEVERRTQTLLLHQQALLRHWRDAATELQRCTRGFLARQRVRRMRNALLEAALAAAHARAMRELHRRQEHAARQIQRIYRRYKANLAYLFDCRRRLHRFVALYVFRWLRQRAAGVIQRVYRRYSMRSRLWRAIRTVLRMLRASRQQEQLVQHAAAFRAARVDAKQRKHQQIWETHPWEMAVATRVNARKTRLTNNLEAHHLPRLTKQPPAPTVARRSSRSTLLPPMR